ncbi:MAG: acetolactate synthase 2 catalytic subunit [Enterobacterales bacterium]|nr:acetolactate synthase 2 catalytic subunit [Enterobacterales bacterium]
MQATNDQPISNPQTGAQLTLKLLQALGVTDIFGYPGGAIMPMYDAIYLSDITHYLCRHEQGAAFAALGYARASGKIGVCMATSGPGATNLITGIADAMADSIPMIAITGQVATKAMGTDGFQEVDIIGLSLACTKHSFQVKDAAELPEIIKQAHQIATTGRPGPVLIDIPKDIQNQPIEYSLSDQSKPLINNESLEINEPSDQYQQALENSLQRSVSEALALIQQAAKPLFYIGGGVGMADAQAELHQLMSRLPFPSVSTLKGIGTIAIDNPLFLGMLGMHGSKAANLAIQQCDLMIVFGARFDDRATGKLNEFAPHAKVIHCDIDAAEINKRRHADVAINSHLKPCLQQINESINQQPIKAEVNKWLGQCQQFLTDDNYPYQQYPGQGVFAPDLLRCLSDQILQQSEDSQPVYITTDVGQHQMWAAQHMQFCKPENFITSSGLGTMGFGVPAAIGAQISHANCQAICISGDGSFMMNVQELGTIKRYHLPVKILLIDNSRLGLVRQWQQLFFEGRYSETDLSDNPDFVALAKAFDIQAESINQKHQVNDAIKRMLASDKAYLLHVTIDAFENVWPLVPPETANHKMIHTISGDDSTNSEKKS